MKKQMVFALLTAVFCAPFSLANASDFTKLDGIVAVVNTEVITGSQLQQEIDKARKQMEHSNIPQLSESELHKKVLDHLIDKSIQLQFAKQKNIKATPEEVKKAIESIAKQNHLSLAQLKPAVESSGLDYDEFQRQIQEQILLQRVQQSEVVSKMASPTEEEVSAFLRKNQGKMENYSAFHVLDLVVANEKQAQDVVKSLQKRTDTEEITKQTGAQNNDLGWRALTEFPSIFSAQIANMHVGDVSKPIHAPNGYHILKLIDAKGDKVKLTKKDAQNLAFQMKASEAVKKWMEEQRKSAYVKIMR